MKKGLSGRLATVLLLIAPSILSGDRKPIVAVIVEESKEMDEKTLIFS